MGNGSGKRKSSFLTYSKKTMVYQGEQNNEQRMGKVI